MESEVTLFWWGYPLPVKKAWCCPSSEKDGIWLKQCAELQNVLRLWRAAAIATVKARNCVLCDSYVQMSNFELTWPSTGFSRSPDAIQLCPVELSHRAQFRSQMWECAECDRATREACLLCQIDLTLRLWLAAGPHMFETARYCQAAFRLLKVEWTKFERIWVNQCEPKQNIEHLSTIWCWWHWVSWGSSMESWSASSAKLRKCVKTSVMSVAAADRPFLGPRTWQFCNHWTF